MKKLILTSVALAITSSAFCQGFVTILAGANNATKMSTNSAVGGISTGTTVANSDGVYYYALFASSSQTSINGSTAAVSGQSANYVFNNLGGGTPSTGWELVGIATNTLAAGRIANFTQGTTSGNQGALNGDGSMSVANIAGGASAQMVVVGWDSIGIGTTLAALEAWYTAGAQGGWIGQSAVTGPLTLGDGSLNGVANPFGTGTGQVSGILLGETPTGIIPEPSTMALAGIGGLSLLAFRRKK